MRFTQRFEGLKKWVKAELCEGRSMKAPGEKMDITDVQWREPSCYLGWAPAKMDQAGNLTEIPASTVPGIIIMPNQQYAKYMEERRFDRYNGIHRPKEMGQHLGITMLFSVYEPGVRLPGFVESGDENGNNLDMSLLLEGTEQGFYTLFNWLDDCMSGLLGQKMIPETDLFVDEESVTYSLYTDQNYVTDRRPLYYGFVNVVFGCYANEKTNPEIDNLL
ncbi:hypothetical protein JRC49_03315 [Clostridiales bacterium FE2011]|nr:hypothetical protein JRC49_03315 [Clostridiales bacterium FE2011]